MVFHGAFADRIETLRHKLPAVRGWLWVDDGSGPCPEWATPYEDGRQSTSVGRQRAPWGRDGDDLYMLYTGGTTGMPKGVMWRQDDIFWLVNPGTMPPYPDQATIDDMVAQRKTIGAGMKSLPACPLMHGTGAFTSFGILSTGGSIVTLEGRTFEAEEFLDAVEKNRVNALAIVGDAFAKPMLRALDANPGRWDLSSLVAITSSGVMWSEETKQGLLKHHPAMLLADAFSSSEALGMGTSVSRHRAAHRRPSSRWARTQRVITDDGRDVVPGLGRDRPGRRHGRAGAGRLLQGPGEVGARSVIDGERYSIPGDYATVEADGTLTLLGRGSVCINTGGEKVFPEEVEEVLKLHPTVRDAVVVGVPDEKFGEAITADGRARAGRDARRGRDHRRT